MERKPRHIVIIGGGVIGCTTAYFLTRHKEYDPAIHKITIIEAAGIASSASGKAGGLLGLWANRAVETVPLSFRLHEELAREHDGEKRWGYRKLQGCGTINTKLNVDDLPFKERAAFPKLLTQGAGVKRQKLSHSSQTLPKNPDASKQTPTSAPLESSQPLLSHSYLPRETSQKRKPTAASSIQSSAQMAPASESDVLSKYSPNPQNDKLGDAALYIKSTGDKESPMPMLASQLHDAVQILPQRILPASSTGSSTRWKAHAILPNGEYYIGDWTNSSNKISDGHCPTHSRGSDNGLEECLEQGRLSNTTPDSARVKKAVSSEIFPLAVTCSRSNPDLNSNILLKTQETPGDHFQPKKEDGYHPPGRDVQASSILHKIADQLPIADSPVGPEREKRLPVSPRQDAMNHDYGEVIPAAKNGMLGSTAIPPRRSGRQRTVNSKTWIEGAGISNGISTKNEVATLKFQSVKQTASAKRRTKGGGRKDRTGMFPNSCVFPPDLTWINRDLVSSYKKQGAGDKNDTAQVHPYQFTHWMAKLAERRGVRIRQGVLVTGIDYVYGKGVRGVEILERNSNKRAVIGEGVTDIVVAAGSWTSTLLPKTEISGVRAHSVVWEVDVTPHAVFTNINLPRGYIPSHRLSKGETVKRSKKVVSSDPEAYARPFKEVYACGAVDHEVELPPTADLVTVDESHCDDIITWLGLVSPVLADAAVKHKQACYMPLREGGDEEPLFGRTLTPGLWLAAGHSCWGIQNAPACGLLMAEMLMDGRTTSLDEEVIAAYDPRRVGV